MPRFCTFKLTTNATRFGAFICQDQSKIVDLTNVIPGIQSLSLLLKSNNLRHMQRLAEVINQFSSSSTTATTATTATTPAIFLARDVELCSPILQPGKVLCVGMNYREHCVEQNFPIPLEPVIFNKFTESVTGPNSNVYFDSELTQQMDYEVELALVIGKSGRDISTDEALRHVAGVTVAHDVSSRDWQFQHNENQWLLGKCQDTFCPLGPSLVTLDELPNQSLDNLRITSRLNGVTVQDSTTSEFIFDVPSIINWISTFVTLSPGDVILTGTPSGVGCFRTPPLWLKHGDVVECEIESIGTLRNLMVDKRQAASSGGDGGSGSGSDGSGEMLEL